MNLELAKMYGTVSDGALEKLASDGDIDLDQISAADFLSLMDDEDDGYTSSPVLEEAMQKLAAEDQLQYDTLGRVLAHQVVTEMEAELSEEMPKTAAEYGSQSDRIRTALITRFE
jgi:hypothetical protein